MKTVRLLCFLAAAGLLRAAAPPPPASDTVITSDTVDMRSTDTETTTVFDGTVKLVGNDITVTCDHLVVVSTSLGDKSVVLAPIDRFKSLVATGHVRIVQGVREATCGRAEIFPRDNKLVLTENPIVVDSSGPYVVTGDRLNLLRGERRITGDVVKVTGPPVQDLGPDAGAGKPPGAAPGPPKPHDRPGQPGGRAPRPPRFPRSTPWVSSRPWPADGGQRRRPPGAGRRDRRLSRPQRRGQDHHVLPHGRPGARHRGRVFLDGRDITRLRMHQRARLGLGYLPQEPSIFRKLTVAQNILAIVEAVGVPRRDRAALVERSWRSFASPPSPASPPTRSPAASAAAWRSPARS